MTYKLAKLKMRKIALFYELMHYMLSKNYSKNLYFILYENEIFYILFLRK